MLTDHVFDPNTVQAAHWWGFQALGTAYLDWKRGVDLFRKLLREMGSEDARAPEQIRCLPPVSGFILAGLYELAPDEKTAQALLVEAYPAILRYHRLLYSHRDPEEEGLIGITNFEQTLLYGRKKINPAQESNPTLSALIQDPVFNSLLVWSNECLVDIGHHLGQSVEEIILWNELTIYSINDKLWIDDISLYGTFDLQEQVLTAATGLGGLMPLIGGIPDQDQAERLLDTLKSNRFRYLFDPGHAKGSESSAPQHLSIVDNWLIGHGLWRFGMAGTATVIQRTSLDLIQHFGFKEYYDLNAMPVKEAQEEKEIFLPAVALCVAWLEEN